MNASAKQGPAGRCPRSEALWGLTRDRECLCCKLMDASNDAIMLCDACGNIREANRKAVEQFGHSREELLSLNIADLSVPEDRENITAGYASVKEDGQGTFTVRCLRKGNGPFTGAVAALRVTMGKEAIALVMVRDVTGRGRIVAELNKERYLIHALMDLLPDHVFFKDLDSHFIRINKALARTFGLSDPEEAVGKTDADFFTEEHAKSALEDERQIIKTLKPIVAKEEKETWPGGRQTWVSTTKVPMFDTGGKLIGTLGVSRDVTAQKEQEEKRHNLELRLQRADKMESLGMLASGIAHDFNNLLMGMLGNASLAVSMMPAHQDALEIVKQIETAALRAADLTNQLLAYSGRGNTTIGVLDLPSLTREVAKLLEVTISKNVALRYEFAENVPQIEGDPTQLRQVIMNLIKNASDAIGDRTGTITITIGDRHCDEEYLRGITVNGTPEAGHYVSLAVSDTGSGIPPEVQAKIFDPFFTTKPMGRGLGLATVLGIVRGHKGAIKVNSEVGKGTTFTVFFKASKRPTVIKHRQEKEEKREWHGHGTVLIVDDDDIIRQVGSQMMKVLGFEVLLASTGAEAIDIFQAKKDSIAVVMLDEVMPRLGGEDVFAELRKIKPDARVVLCSGYAECDVTARFAGKGLAGFIQKPFTIQSLYDVLANVIEKKPA